MSKTHTGQYVAPWIAPPTVPLLTFILGILSVDLNFDMLGVRTGDLAMAAQYYHRMTHRPVVFDALVLLVCLGIFVAVVQNTVAALSRHPHVSRDGRLVIALQILTIALLAACKLDIDWAIKPFERDLAALHRTNVDLPRQRELLETVYLHHGALVIAVVVCCLLQFKVISVVRRI